MPVKKHIGGMFLPKQQNLENVVLDYLENSNIKNKSKGSYGVTYILDVKNINNIKNPFLSFEANANLGAPVKKLIVKLCSIEYEKDEDINTTLWDIVENNLGISPTNQNDFINEINIQTDIFLKSFSYLQPLCPAIAYSGFLEYKNPIQRKIINMFNSGIEKEIDDDYEEFKPYFKFGIIVMQLADNYDTVYKLNGKKMGMLLSDKNMQCSCLFILLQLALITGYTHGDHHISNIMYNPNDHTYFGNSHSEYGRPLLIDFGRTTKIPSVQMKEIKELAKNHSYTKILEKLCKKPIANEFIRDLQYQTHYGWACMFYYGDYDNELRALFQFREMAIDEVTEEMYALHSYNNNYPLLPLSNSVKNKLYNGLLNVHSIRKKSLPVTKATIGVGNPFKFMNSPKPTQPAIGVGNPFKFMNSPKPTQPTIGVGNPFNSMNSPKTGDLKPGDIFKFVTGKSIFNSMNSPKPTKAAIPKSKTKSKSPKSNTKTKKRK